VPISNVRIVTKGQSRRTGANLDGHLINKKSKLLSNGSSYAKIVGATSITPTIQSSGVLRRSLGRLGCFPTGQNALRRVQGILEPPVHFLDSSRGVLCKAALQDQQRSQAKREWRPKAWIESEPLQNYLILKSDLEFLLDWTGNHLCSASDQLSHKTELVRIGVPLERGVKCAGAGARREHTGWRWADCSHSIFD